MVKHLSLFEARRRRVRTALRARAGVYLGATLSAQNAWLILRGIDTLFARMKTVSDTAMQVARALEQRHGVSALIMGCTEIPLALSEGAHLPGVRLVNPTQVLAAALARHAYVAMADATLLR